ncbi:MAG: hypothetical protein ACRCSG_03885 [Cellulosilyticaceae bacterium]
MIFNYLFFSKNHEKRKYLKTLEIKLITLFDNYRVAWNNFCTQLGPTSTVPKLHFTISTHTLQSCLSEIDKASTALCNTINNIFYSIHLPNLLNKSDASLKFVNLYFTEYLLKSIVSLGDSIVGFLAFKLLCNNFFVPHVYYRPNLSLSSISQLNSNLNHTAPSVHFNRHAPNAPDFPHSSILFDDAALNASLKSFPNNNINNNTIRDNTIRDNTIRDNITKPVSKEFKLVSSISNVTMIILLTDFILSFVEEFIVSQLLEDSIKQTSHILTLLTHIITTETSALLSITQSLQDGIIWLDSEHMLLIDKKTSIPSLFVLDQFN